jgi:hypothetical protein
MLALRSRAMRILEESKWRKRLLDYWERSLRLAR